MTIHASTPPATDSPSCGPDLDLDGDPDYLNFMAFAEGLLPQSYFSYTPPERGFRDDLATLDGLLKRSRDLRLLVVRAKLQILGDDYPGFVQTLSEIADLLERAWDTVHPVAEDGDFGYRTNTLVALDDLGSCILPLQYARLLEHPRIGAFRWRAQMVAAGAASARAGEKLPDSGRISSILSDVPLAEVTARLAQAEAHAAAIARIEAWTRAAALDAPSALVTLPRQEALAGELVAFLRGWQRQRDPAAAAPETEATSPTDGAPVEAAPAGPGSAGPLASRKAALDLLDGVIDFHGAQDPTSLARVLLVFAREICDRPLHEALHLMMPSIADRAGVPITAGGIRLALDRLAEPLSASGSGGSDERTPTPVTSRTEATRSLDSLIAYFRAAEPASPLATLLARAREVSGRDFQSLLRDLFSPSVLERLRSDD